MSWTRIWQFYLDQPELAVLLVGNVLFALGTVFLAGTALFLRIRNDRKARRWAELEGRWSATSLDVVGGAQKPTKLWALVPDRDRLRFIDFLLRFARRLVGPERRVVDDLAAPYLDLLLPQLADRRPERRARAVQTLSTLGRRRYAAHLERALDERLVFVIGSAFYVDGQGHDKVRLSFSAPTPERIEEGVRRLARVVKAGIGV